LFTSTHVVLYVLLQLVAPFSGHVMSKVCQYATNDTKISVGTKETSIIKAQSGLQKIITWIKKSGKGRQEWESMCKETG
jgi:hypothetical protein